MITGTIVNYYIHCKTQCWLFANRINLEENSEDVRIGRVLHEISETRVDEVAFENIKLDRITKEYVVEVKKSDSDIEAAKWQLLFYLWRLERVGVRKKGRLEVFEKKKGERKRYEVALGDEERRRLEEMEREIAELVAGPMPEPKLQSKCRRCAYYEYCFV
jgi:CRISPR-associated exonuclease Cas4